MQQVQKRTYKRFGFDGHVDVKVKDDQRRILRAYLADIGVGGCRIHIPGEMELERNVNFSLITPFMDRPLKGRGKVRYLAPARHYGSDYYTMGIEFTRINIHKIKGLIGRAFGWRKKPLLSRQHRRELKILFKIVPLLLLFISLAVGLQTIFAGESTEGRAGYVKSSNFNTFYISPPSPQAFSAFSLPDSFSLEMYNDYSGVLIPNH